jgi:hypothetical protein
MNTAPKREIKHCALAYKKQCRTEDDTQENPNIYVKTVFFKLKKDGKMIYKIKNTKNHPLLTEEED